MEDAADLMTFAGNPLDRASQLRSDPEWIAAQLAAPDAVFLPIYRGDPLVRDGSTVFLSAQARREFPQDAVTVFLGLKNGAPHFVVDFSSAPLPQDAPFADFGQYAPIRDAAFSLPGEDMAIIGEARWFLV